MDFDQAIIAHARWKIRLKDYIEGKEQLNLETLGKDDQCDLGKWLYADAKKFANLSAFADLKLKHAKFHTVAAKAARDARTSPPGKAVELLDPIKSEFGRASSQVINAITALRAAIPK